MAMTADSALGHHENNSAGSCGESVSSPSKRKNFPAPWAQVVRGEQEWIKEAGEASSSSFLARGEGNNGNNGGKANSNGVAIMGAVSWPALSECTTKPSPFSLSAADSSPKALPDSPLSISQGPQIPHLPQKQGTGHSKSISTQNHTLHAWRRPMKSGSGGSSTGSSSPRSYSQNNFAHPPQAPPSLSFSMYPMPPNGFSNPMPDHSPRGANQEARAVGTFVPQPHVVNDHRHSPRKANLGSHGDGPHQNNFVGWRDQGCGQYSNAIDANVQRGSPRGFVRSPPPSTTAFVQSQSMRPYSPIGYPDFAYCPPLPMELFRSVPYLIPPPAPQYVLDVEELLAKLVNQIEYYFSDANLAKDDFLKANMDDQGWVPITLIAGFNRVKSMTNNIQLIVDSLRTSILLEVQDDKVRRRSDWMKWIPSSGRMPPDTTSHTLGVPGYDTLTTKFQNVSMEDVATDQNRTADSSSLSMDVPGRYLSEHVSQNEGSECISSC